MKKSLVRQLEALNTKLWQEAIRFEKMRAIADELEIKCEVLLEGKRNRSRESFAAQDRALKGIGRLSWGISDLEEKCQDLAWQIDQIVDDVEET